MSVPINWEASGKCPFCQRPLDDHDGWKEWKPRRALTCPKVKA